MPKGNEFDEADRFIEGEDEDGITCRRCGMGGLVMMNTGMRWALFEEKGHEHHCRALDSDFEDLTQPS